MNCFYYLWLGCLGVSALRCASGDSRDLDNAENFPMTQAPAFCDPNDADPAGPLCATSVSTAAEFDILSLKVSNIQYWDRAAKYMVPAADDPELIPPLFQNTNRNSMHLEFLNATFFPGLSGSEYIKLVMNRETRSYYTGNFIRIIDPDQGELYGFTVYAAAATSEQLEPVEVRNVYEQLHSVFTAGPLVYTFEPFDALGPTKAKAWVDPGFPMFFPNHNQVDVEVYTPGINYGRIRRFTIEEFETAERSGLLGYRDLLVIDQVPFDIESVAAGVVTGGRQWELSHVNVRMAGRGTPNLYVKDALDAFAPWDNQLVRLEALNDSSSSDTYIVTAAEEAEAEAWWAAHRPKLGDVPEVDDSYTALLPLTEMDTDDEPVPLVSRIGGKAANLAKLYSFLDDKYQVRGFAVPFAYFDDFMNTNRIVDERSVLPEEVTLKEYIRRLSDDPDVAEDTMLRRRLLLNLRERILTEGQVSEPLVDDLYDAIRSEFGSDDVKVKFRSSSNIEDSLAFSGAGLYTSTGVCAADSKDGNLLGPSLCDSDKNEEMGIERGLLTVWSSLFNDRAWDERDWYQVPQDAASMAILVTEAFPDELANGVAFTGNPADPSDARFLINAQIGDEKVVGNDPSIIPELDLLTVADGEVTRIYRIRSSVLAEPGEPVLSDEQLDELGALMASVDAEYPLSLGTHARDEVLLDMEFKIAPKTNGIKIKQIRPFLKTATEAAP